MLSLENQQYWLNRLFIKQNELNISLMSHFVAEEPVDNMKFKHTVFFITL
jgi:hypothetical protein